MAKTGRPRKAKAIADPVSAEPEVAPVVEPDAPPAETPAAEAEPAPPPKVKHPDEDVVLMPKYVPTYSPYGDGGDYAADHRLDKDRAVMIHGERYEHCSETPDGRWVYRKG